MPADYNGTWEMESNENFEGYMVALGKMKNINYIFFVSKIFLKINKKTFIFVLCLLA